MLSLGDINFGLGVDTSALDKAVSSVVSFGAAVERAATLTGEGAASAAAAFRRQEAAALSALQTTLNLTQAMRQQGASAESIQTVTAAYEALATTLTKAGASSLEIQRAQESFRATLASTRRDLRDLKAGVEEAIAAESKLTFTPAAGFSKLVADKAGVKQSFLDAAGSADVFKRELAALEAQSTILSTSMRSLIASDEAAASSLMQVGNAASAAGRQYQSFFTQIRSTGFNTMVSDLAGVKTGMLNAAQSAEVFMREMNIRPVTGFAEKLKDVASAATLTMGPLSGIGARVTAFTSIINRSNVVLASSVIGFAAFSAALYKLGEGAISTAMQLQVIQSRLTVLYGSSVIAGAQLDQLHQFADKVGLSFLSVADSFSRFTLAAQGSKLTMSEVQKVFEAVAGAAANVNLSAEQTQLVFLAVEQMMSKGTVASEELRKQLGNALPGAFATAASAMGVTEAQLNQLLKTGQVMADDFLPKFGQALAKNLGGTAGSDTLVRNLDRLHTAAQTFSIAFNNAAHVSDIYMAAVKTLTSVLNSMAASMNNIVPILGAIGGALLAAFGPQIISAIATVAMGIVSLTEKIIALDVATLASGWGKIATIFLKVAAVLGGAVAGYEVLNSVVGQSTDKYTTATAKLQAYIDAQMNAKKVNSALTQDQLNTAKDSIAAIQGVVDKDREHLTALQEQQALYQNTSLNPVDLIWDPLQKAIDEATKKLKDHENELSILIELQAKLKGILADQKKLQDDEAAGLTTKQQQQFKQIYDQIDGNNKLAAAYRESTGAVQRMQTVIGDTRSLDQLEKSMTSMKQPPAVVAQAVNDMAASLQNLHAGEAAGAITTELRAIGDNWKVAAAQIQSTALGDYIKSQLDIKNQVYAYEQSLIGLGESSVVAATAADDLRQSLLALASAGLVEAQRQAQQTIERTLAMADAQLQGRGAVQALQDAFAQQDKLKDFADNLIKAGDAAGMTAEQFQRFQDIVNHPTEDKQADLEKLVDELVRTGTASADAAGKLLAFWKALDAGKVNEATTAVQEIDDRIKGLNDQLAAIPQGWRAFDQAKDAAAATKQVNDEYQKLIDKGVAPDVARQKVEQLRESLKSLSEAQPAIDAARQAYRDFVNMVDNGADKVSKDLTDMMFAGKFSAKTLVDDIQDMVKQMIAEIIKLKVIKPLLESIFQVNLGGGGGGGGGGLFGGGLSVSSMIGALMGQNPAMTGDLGVNVTPSPVTGQYSDSIMQAFKDGGATSAHSIADAFSNNAGGGGFLSSLDASFNRGSDLFGNIFNGLFSALSGIGGGGGSGIGGILGSLFGGASNGGGLFSIFDGLFSSGGAAAVGGTTTGLEGLSSVVGFLADGGPAAAGSPYIVGEEGPELFVPGTSGTVIPNGQFGGGDGQLVRVIVEPSELFHVSVEQAAGHAATKQINHYDQQVLPARVNKINKDPRHR